MAILKDARWARYFLLSLYVVGVGVVFRPTQAIARQESAEQQINKVVIELFYRGDSDQSLKSKQFLDELQKRRPGLEVKAYDLINDKRQLKRMLELSKQYGHAKPGLPAFYLCDTLQLGFRDAASTGAQIEDLLTINAYIRPGCKHCKAGKRFLDEMVLRYPAIHVRYHDVISDINARTEVQRLADLYQVQIPSFPCIRAAGRLFIGYQTDEISGRRIEDLFIDRSIDFPQDEGDNHSDRPGDASATDGQEPKKKSSIKSANHLIASAAQFGPGLSEVFALIGPRSPVTGIAIPSSDLLERVQGTAEKKSQSATQESPVKQGVQPESPQELELPQEFSLPDEVELPGDVPPDSDQPMAIVVDSATTEVDPEHVEVPFFGNLSVSKLGMPAFTFLIGLVDGFNPCAMWVLVFLLSVLVNIKERKKILLVAGTFVIVSGLAYFTFMAAWFNVFQFIGLLRPVQIGLGVMAIIVGTINVKDFFAFHKGITLSIPEASKPGIYKRVRKIVAAKHMSTALGAAVVLAIVVNVVELLCTAGLPALYTEVLTMQNLPAWVNYSYLGLYILAYMLDDAILVGIVVMTLSHRRLQESEGRWLKLLSGVVILLLGLVMIVWPEILV